MKAFLPKESQEDARITAPLLSWKTVLVLFAIVFLLVVTQSFILDEYLDRIPLLVVVLTYYLIGVCLFLGLLVGLIWRSVIGKPLRKISRAARKVASGDFSVQIEPRRVNKGGKTEIDVLIEDFNTMTRELASNEMLKSDFIANVSHEIKTPLSVIQSYTKALKDGCAPSEERGQYMDTIVEAAGKLNDMVTNILKLTKLENQQIFPSPTTFQLGEQLRRCALAFMEKWQAKDIAFAIDVADVAVHYDASLLELVWNNLLSNAIKFTEPGGQISLTSEVVGQTVRVTVRDSGCGMDEETQKRIFEKFYQGDTSHAAQGNGLGLALVKKIVDIADGQIAIESAPGEGTACTVELKL